MADMEQVHIVTHQSFVIYHKETTKFICIPRANSNYYKTLAAAKAALTRAIKAGVKGADDKPLVKEDFLIADTQTFYDSIEKKEIRHGIVGSEGKTFEVGVNTSWSSGPWSESYWCN